MHKQYILNSIITSDLYFDFLLLQLLASFLVLLYVAIKPMDNVNSEIVTTVEGILTFLYLIDLFIRRTLQKRKFMQSIWNIFDVIFFILIVILTVIFNILELHKNVSQNFLQDQDMLGFMILSIRYFFQIIRIIFIFYRSKNIYNIHKYSQALQLDINSTYNSYKDSFILDPFKTNLFNEMNSQSFAQANALRKQNGEQPTKKQSWDFSRMDFMNQDKTLNEKTKLTIDQTNNNSIQYVI